jgi:hypothetical protein
MSGDVYWVDPNGCLNLKLAEVSNFPWQNDGPFERNGISLDDFRHYYDIWYEVVAEGSSMAADGCTAHWCPLPVSAARQAVNCNSQSFVLSDPGC